MAEFHGVPCQWAISTTSYSNSSSLGTGVLVKTAGQNFEHTAQIDRLVERTGENIGRVVFNRGKMISADLWPSADTIAHADGAVLVKPGDILTLTDTLDTDVGSTFSGKYHVEKASKVKRTDSKVMWNVTLTQDSTDTTTVVS